MKKESQTEGRTTDLGLYNFAESYKKSAQVLMENRNKLKFSDSINFLLIHSIELYLKSLLKYKGFSLKELKEFSHNFLTLSKISSVSGLNLNDKENKLIKTISESNLLSESKYIVTGFKRNYTDSLYNLSESISDKVEIILKEKHLRVR